MHVLVYPPAGDARAGSGLNGSEASGAQASGSEASGYGRWARAASYIIEPSGTLRSQFGTGALDGRLPPFARRLSPLEFDDVYFRALDAGLLNPGHPGRVASAGTYRPPAGAGPVAVFDLVTQGRERVLAIDLGEEGSRGPRAFVDRLAALSWQPE